MNVRMNMKTPRPSPAAHAPDPQLGLSRPLAPLSLQPGRDEALAPTSSSSPPPEERRILAFMGEIRRMGRWSVPRLLRIRAWLGEVKVDLRDNEIPSGFMLDARAWGARVTLIVPPELSVAFDVFALMGNAINQAPEPRPETPRASQIRVVGSAFMGEIRVIVRERGA